MPRTCSLFFFLNEQAIRVDILKVCFKSGLKIILVHNYFKKYLIWGLNDRWKNLLKRYSLSGIVAILINWWGIHLPPLRRRGEVTSESKVNSPFLKVATSETRRTKELNIGWYNFNPEPLNLISDVKWKDNQNFLPWWTLFVSINHRPHLTFKSQNVSNIIQEEDPRPISSNLDPRCLNMSSALMGSRTPRTLERLDYRSSPLLLQSHFHWI